MVIGAYEKLNEQGIDKSHFKIEPPEKSASKLTVSLSKTNSEKSDIKARGQITVDNCFVIKGVSVAERTNSKTNEKFNVVNLPHFKQDDKGNYPLVVTPISSDMHNKVNDAVLKTFNTQTRGVKFSELGDKEDTSSLFRQNNAFAEKLMNELDSKGIPYHAKIIPDTVKADVKIAGNTTVSFKTADKAAIENIRKSIANDERKPSALGEISKIKEEKAQTEKTAPTKEKLSKNQNPIIKRLSD